MASGAESTSGGEIVTGGSQPILEVLFEDEWERRWFVEHWIVGPADHAMPWEVTEQRPDLGPVFVACDDPGAFFESPRIRCEALFVPVAALEGKRDAAFAWAQGIAARDILPAVVAYQLDERAEDFTSAVLVALPWGPAVDRVGARFSYQGTGYLLPSRAISVAVNGALEVEQVAEDEEGELWFEVRDQATGECLYLTGSLLRGASVMTR